MGVKKKINGVSRSLSEGRGFREEALELIQLWEKEQRLEEAERGVVEKQLSAAYALKQGRLRQGQVFAGDWEEQLPPVVVWRNSGGELLDLDARQFSIPLERFKASRTRGGKPALTVPGTPAGDWSPWTKDRGCLLPLILPLFRPDLMVRQERALGFKPCSELLREETSSGSFQNRFRNNSETMLSLRPRLVGYYLRRRFDHGNGVEGRFLVGVDCLPLPRVEHWRKVGSLEPLDKVGDWVQEGWDLVAMPNRLKKYWAGSVQPSKGYLVRISGLEEGHHREELLDPYGGMYDPNRIEAYRKLPRAYVTRAGSMALHMYSEIRPTGIQYLTKKSYKSLAELGRLLPVRRKSAPSSLKWEDIEFEHHALYMQNGLELLRWFMNLFHNSYTGHKVDHQAAIGYLMGMLSRSFRCCALVVYSMLSYYPESDYSKEERMGLVLQLQTYMKRRRRYIRRTGKPYLQVSSRRHPLLQRAINSVDGWLLTAKDSLAFHDTDGPLPLFQKGLFRVWKSSGVRWRESLLTKDESAVVIQSIEYERHRCLKQRKKREAQKKLDLERRVHLSYELNGNGYPEFGMPLFRLRRAMSEAKEVDLLWKELVAAFEFSWSLRSNPYENLDSSIHWKEDWRGWSGKRVQVYGGSLSGVGSLRVPWGKRLFREKEANGKNLASGDRTFTEFSSMAKLVSNFEFWFSEGQRLRLEIDRGALNGFEGSQIEKFGLPVAKKVQGTYIRRLNKVSRKLMEARSWMVEGMGLAEEDLRLKFIVKYGKRLEVYQLGVLNRWEVLSRTSWKWRLVGKAKPQCMGRGVLLEEDIKELDRQRLVLQGYCNDCDFTKLRHLGIGRWYYQLQKVDESVVSLQAILDLYWWPKEELVVTEQFKSRLVVTSQFILEWKAVVSAFLRSVEGYKEPKVIFRGKLNDQSLNGEELVEICLELEQVCQQYNGWKETYNLDKKAIKQLRAQLKGSKEQKENLALVFKHCNLSQVVEYLRFLRFEYTSMQTRVLGLPKWHRELFRSQVLKVSYERRRRFVQWLKTVKVDEV